MVLRPVRRSAVRMALRSLGILAVVLLLTGAGVVYSRSGAAIHRRYAITRPSLPMATDSAAGTRGRHLVEDVLACKECHGADHGGSLLIDAGIFMRLSAPNLTRGTGGIGARLGPEDWAQAIRHGVGHDGRPLAVMPSRAYQHLSDADLAAVIAYLQRLPAVDFAPPTRRFGPIARLFLARGSLPLFSAEVIDHAAGRPASSPRPGATVEYGRYLADVAGCTDCHGPGLSGGPVAVAPPGAPPASNITRAGIGGWTEEDFARALREGRGAGGRRLNELMPYRSLRLSDEEIRALWLFVRAMPPRPYGHR
jgi:cytochrome c553